MRNVLAKELRLQVPSGVKVDGVVELNRRKRGRGTFIGERNLAHGGGASSYEVAFTITKVFVIGEGLVTPGEAGEQQIATRTVEVFDALVAELTNLVTSGELNDDLGDEAAVRGLIPPLLEPESYKPPADMASTFVVGEEPETVEPKRWFGALERLGWSVWVGIGIGAVVIFATFGAARRASYDPQGPAWDEDRDGSITSRLSGMMFTNSTKKKTGGKVELELCGDVVMDDDAIQQPPTLEWEEQYDSGEDKDEEGGVVEMDEDSASRPPPPEWDHGGDLDFLNDPFEGRSVKPNPVVMHLLDFRKSSEGVGKANLSALSQTAKDRFVGGD